MKKRIIALVLASVMALSLMACGSKEAPATTDAPAATEEVKEEVATEEASADATPVEITWWTFPVFSQDGEAAAGTYENEVIAAFQEKYPHITVNLETIDFTAGPEKIIAAIEGGTMADVLFDAPGRIITYGNSGVLADISDMFDDATVKDINNEGLLKACQGNGGSYYMYPISGASFFMAFNKAMLEDAGVFDKLNLTGDRTWSTETFEEVIKALAAKGNQGASVYCSGQGGDQGIRAFVSNLYSSWPVADDLSAYTINDEGGVKALSKIKEWVDAGYMLNGSAYNGGEDIEQFCTGQTSFTTLWGPGLAKMRAAQLEENGIEAVAVPFPSDDSKPELEYLVNGFCVFNNGDDAKIAASKEFIRFLCDDAEWGPKNVVRTGVFPVRESFGSLYEGDEAAFHASLNKYFGVYYNTIPGFAEMRTYWFPMLQSVLNGDATPEAALKSFVDNANASIAAAGK